MPLETERLLLRPLADDDAPALARLLAGDWEAIKQTGRMPYPASERALRRWIALHTAPASHSFLIVRRADGGPWAASASAAAARSPSSATCSGGCTGARAMQPRACAR